MSSRDFAPAGATRAGVSLLRERPSFPSWEKKAKARQGGRGPFRLGPLPPWNPQPSATTKGGLRPPVWISPQRRLVRSDIAARAPDTPRYRAAKSERTSLLFARRPNGRAHTLGGIQRGPEGPSLVGGERCRRGGIRIAPSPAGAFAYFCRCWQK